MTASTSTAGTGRPPSPGFRVTAGQILFVLWLALLVAGSIGVVQRFAEGLQPTGYRSYMPWGLWKAIYFQAVAVAGGALAVAGIGYLLKLPGFRRIEQLRMVIVLTVAITIPGLLGVIIDLGRWELFFRLYTSPAFTSMLAFNAWIYTLYLLVAALRWYLSFRTDSGWLKPLLVLGMFLALTSPAQTGVLFGVVEANPLWQSSQLPFLFLASAVAAGAAILLIVRTLLGPGGLRLSREPDHEEHDRALPALRTVALVALGAFFLFQFVEISIAYWTPGISEAALDLMLFGPYWWVFWLVHVGLGGVAPFLLLLSRSRAAWLAGATLVALTLIAHRLNVLIPGQAVQEIQGLQAAYLDERMTYIYRATTMEYLVAMFLVAVGIPIFYVGHRITLNLAARAAATSRGES